MTLPHHFHPETASPGLVITGRRRTQPLGRALLHAMLALLLAAFGGPAMASDLGPACGPARSVEAEEAGRCSD